MSALSLPRAVRRPLIAASAVAALAAGAAACGTSSSGSGNDGPEQAVPAGAVLYAEAVVHPQGDEGANAEALLRKVLRTADPSAELARHFDKAAGKHDVNFARDVEPWLGDKVGAAVIRISPNGEDGAGLAVLDSSDDGEAAGKLDALLGGGTSTSRHREVEVRTAHDRRAAAAVTDGHVLVGKPAEVRAGIDVLKGARESLDDASRFTRAREASGSEGLGFFYADVRSLFRATASAAGPQGALLAPMTETLPDSVSATLHAQSDAFVVDGAAIGGKATQSAAGPGAADAVATAPADSWLAAGIDDVGKNIEQSLNSVGGAGLGSIGVGQLEDMVRRATGGLDLRDDLLSWMGSGVLFVEGDSLATLRGGLVVHSSDPAKSKTAVQRLGRVLRNGGSHVRALRARGVNAGWSVRSSGLPVEILIASAGDRFVVALGRRALDDALRSGPTLGDAAAFRDAAGKLGGDYPPSLWLQLPAVAKLVHRGAGGNAEAERVAQTLQTLGPVNAGSKRDGDVERIKLRVAVP